MLATCTLQYNFRVGGEEYSRPIGSGIGVGNASANGAYVAHLGVTNHARRLRHHAEVLGQQSRGSNVLVGAGRSDGNVLAILADVAQLRQTRNVDECGWLVQTQFERGNQAMASRQHFGVAIVFCQQAQSFIY